MKKINISVFILNLVFAVMSLHVNAESKMFSESDLSKIYSEYNTCLENAKSVTTVNGVATTGTDSIKSKECDSKRRVGIRRLFEQKKCGEKSSDECEEIEAARDEYDSEPTRSEKNCDKMNDEYKDNYKECSSTYENYKDKCTAKNKDLLDSDLVDSVSPLASMFSGMDSIVNMYGAMSDNSQCNLSKEEFRQERDDIKQKINDLEEKISKKTEEMQEAQEKYAEKLNELAEKERKTLDDFNKLPLDQEKHRKKLDEQKVKVKIEAESKYAAVVEQMNTLTADYNATIQDQKGAMYQASDFAIYDKCLQEYEERAKGRGVTPVANGLSGAYYTGNLKRSDKVNYMSNCLKSKNQEKKRVETAFINKLNAIKQKLESMDRMKGQIEEERKLANQAIADEIGNLIKEGDAEAARLRNEYQGIQNDRTQAKALLDQKLATLKAEISKLTMQMNVENMKIQNYTGKKMPTNASKSISDLIQSCGASYESFKDKFLRTCCTKSSGQLSLCGNFKPKDASNKAGKGSKKTVK